MRMLLTSNGIANALIRDTLVDLLGKPIVDSALLVGDPTADPVVVSSGHWRRFGTDGSLVESH